MEESKKGFKIINIVLHDSQFSRIEKFDASGESKLIMDVNTNYDQEKETQHLLCEVRVNYQVKFLETDVMQGTVSMIGIFQMLEVSDKEVETFGSINAPAIIFPFIREHLVSTTSYSGIKTIILQPFNFKALADQRKEKENNSSANPTNPL